jgi:cytochrome c oxidase subunit III
MLELRTAPQFATPGQQHEAALFGIWIFLATEVLFFGAPVALYAAYRFGYPEGFAAAAARTQLVLGALNTAILLTSSAVMASAVAVAKAGRRRALPWLLLGTAALGVAFLAVKGIEYKREFDEHLVPGWDFVFPGTHAGPAALFFSFYFAATGLHALHLTIGIAIVLAMAVEAFRSEGVHATRFEVAGLYWHFVDIVWIFLFPLIYLGGRSG